ncbi:MAG TPA: transcriptional regulator [Croceibacterium sp.]|nr:transcriptional regulator [Croceibacterium sp.]
MNACCERQCTGAIGPEAAFSTLSRAMFGASYPEGAHKLRHNLGPHPLLELEALAWLCELLPAGSVEQHRGDLAIGGGRDPAPGGLKPGEAIRSIRDTDSRLVLNDIERVPAYAALLRDLLGELEPEIVDRTGAMLSTRSCIVVSSPGAVTPYDFDPAHTILLQLAGKTAVSVLTAGHTLVASDPVRERRQTGDGREPTWRDEIDAGRVTFRLEPGEATYVPVMAPRYLRNGPEPSVSLSIAWRSEWSLAEADARAFNNLVRRWGFSPLPPRRWPARNRAKSIAWRALRRLPGID